MASDPSVDNIYRGFFEHALEGFFQTTLEGKYILANPALARMYGYESPQELMEALTNINVQLYVDPQRRAEFARLMKNPGEVIGFESEIYRHDGSVMWISENARVVRDHAGMAILFEGTVQDITVRKRAENELRTSQRFIERVAQSSPNILYVYDLLQCRYVYANDRIFRILGYTLNDLIEKGPEFLKQYSHADDAWLLDERARELSQAEDGEVFEYEFRLLHTDGAWRWINARETLFTRTADGRPHEVIGTAQDITERNRTVKALLQSEERFRRLVEGADAIFWERELTEGRFTYVGPQAEKLLGHPVEDWYIRKFWLENVIEEDRERVAKFWQGKPAVQGGGQAIEYRMKDASQRTVWVRDFGHLSGDETGAHVLQGFMLDITERQVAREEIRRSHGQLRALSARLQSAREEERIRIAREIHDELGGALTSLKMEVSRIASACSHLCEGAGSKWQEFDERFTAMSLLIHTTMETVRRIASELRPPILDAFGIIAAIEWQVSEFEKRFGIRCELQNQWRSNIVQDQALSTAVYRMFQEMLTNVARHSHASKTVVTLREEHENLMLVVSDNGRGITEGERRESLGLLGMQERAMMFAGNVEISGFPGKGTVVTMKIPLKNVLKTTMVPKKERLWR